MKTFLILPVIICLASCAKQEQRITNVADYNVYLTQTVSSDYKLDVDLAFWQERLQRMPGDLNSKFKIAGLYTALFRTTGEARYLADADSIYNDLLKESIDPSRVYLALAQNAITQHQFSRGYMHAKAALNQGGMKAASLLVMADASLELGDLPQAKNILNQFTNRNSFAHRIRQVKVKDQEGDLDSAIVIMEGALERVKGNKNLYCWSLSNLGDMYGHAGRIDDAYKAYISVLRKDPNYDYALKGIAWIAWSHDKDGKEAKRIISALASRRRMPEAHLLLAEIAGTEGNKAEKMKHLQAFIEMTDKPGYKTMYAKYLADVYIEMERPLTSLQIAEEEIKNRPSPQSYDMKAWALFQSGRVEEALRLAKSHVENQTYEPDVAYHTGMIYLANGLHEPAEKFLVSALESSFELGPVLTREIENALKSI